MNIPHHDPFAITTLEAMPRVELGALLKARAERCGFTQAGLSALTGIHRATISKVFHGGVHKLAHYHALAGALDTSLEALIQPPDSTPRMAATPSHGSPTRHATVITVAIQKGGSGKTTTVVNLAAIWAERGHKVLIIDLDMQGHCALHLGEEADGEPLMRAIRERERVEPVQTAWGVDLLAGGSALRALTPHLLSSINPLTEIKRLIKRYRTGYDLILIDTAPSLETTTCNALVAADQLLIPVQTETGALEGLAALYEVYEMLAEDHGPLSILACVPTLHDTRTVLHEQLLEALTSHAHLRPTQTVIRRAVPVAEAFTLRTPLHVYAPQADVTRAFEALCDELTERLERCGALGNTSSTEEARS